MSSGFYVGGSGAVHVGGAGGARPAHVLWTDRSKWGNSLAIRLPRAFAEELGLGDGAAVRLSLTDEGLLLTPARPSPPCLDDLLAGVTRRNLHGEVDTGRPVGREVW